MSLASTTGANVQRTASEPTGLPRLLDGAAGADLSAHLNQRGSLPVLGFSDLHDLVRDAGLTGRGGAAFPVARKLASLDRKPRGLVVVANSAESEPLSGKDRTLLMRAPHLVIDGLSVVARAVGAARAIVYVHRDRGIESALASALAARGDDLRVEIVTAPARFVAGQETAVVSRISGGAAIPAWSTRRVTTRGVGGRPTLVHNAETLAHIALIARYAAPWFRAVGTETEPGSMLVSLHPATSPGAGQAGQSGPPHGSRIFEVALGASMSDLLPRSDATAVLVGGFHGVWLDASAARGARLSNASLRPLGASLGAGIVAELPGDRCGIRETARIMHYLAHESAGQCGPCLNGLPRISRAMTALAACGATTRDVDDVRRWCALVVGRGACHHPDGSVRLVASALQVFATEVDRHLGGSCSAENWEPVFALPANPRTEADWR